MEDLKKSKEDDLEEEEEEKESSIDFDNVSMIIEGVNEYDVINILGKGGFGYVYLVKEFNSNKEYAIKIFKELNDNSYHNEVKMYNKISNKEKKNSYIIKMFNYGECKIIAKKYFKNKTNFILLEYASKGCLFDYIYEKEKISFKIGNNN